MRWAMLKENMELDCVIWSDWMKFNLNGPDVVKENDGLRSKQGLKVSHGLGGNLLYPLTG